MKKTQNVETVIARKEIAAQKAEIARLVKAGKKPAYVIGTIC